MEVGADLDEMINRLMAIGAVAAKAHKTKNAPNFSGKEVKSMAAHLGLTQTGSKDDLVDRIILKRTNTLRVQSLPDSDSEDDDSDAEEDDRLVHHLHLRLVHHHSKHYLFCDQYKSYECAGG